MPYPTEHSARILNPGSFDVIRRVNNKFGSGIHAIFGRKGDGPMKVQAVRFDAKKFTVAQAKKWLSDNNYKPIEFEPASGAKEIDMPDEVEQVEEIATEKCMAEPPAGYVPFGVTTFAQLQAAEAAQEATGEVHELASQFQGIVGNIMADPNLEDKAAAVTSAAAEFATLVNQAMSETKEKEAPVTVEIDGKGFMDGFFENVVNTVAERLGLKPKAASEPESAPDPGLMLWKEGERYRWLAVFSNKYRDDDTPPEILASDAHKEFVGAVESGAWPYPELRHFHVKGTKWGTSDWLHYDDPTGFSLASGWVDAGHEKEAEAVAALIDGGETIRVSHGMPISEIRRDEKDSTIITRYRSIEISDLPGWAAANRLTGFEIKENDMPIPDTKKDYLKKAGLSDEEIAAIEAGLVNAAKEAENLESKAAPEAEAAPEAPVSEPAPDAPASEPPLTRQEILEAIQAAIGPLADGLAALQAGIKELKEAKEIEAKEVIAATPAFSLVEMIKNGGRAVGDPAAQVEKGTRVKGPKETKAPPEISDNIVGIPFISQMLMGAGKQQEQ